MIQNFRQADVSERISDKRGSIIDATIVEAPKQRNSRDEKPAD